MEPTRVKSRRKLASRIPTFKVGQRAQGQKSHGGGGPENAGAKPSNNAAISLRTGNVPHMAEDLAANEYMGYAAPSTKPHVAGTRPNNFRELGDNYGGRQ